MLVKFWGTNQGGGDGDGSVNYLLNERVKQGTAKVLRGDANLTKSLLPKTNALKPLAFSYGDTRRNAFRR